MYRRRSLQISDTLHEPEDTQRSNRCNSSAQETNARATITSDRHERMTLIDDYFGME